MTIQQTLLSSGNGLNWIQTTSGITAYDESGANDENQNTYIVTTTTGGTYYVYVTKYDPSGSPIWATRLVGMRYTSYTCYDPAGYLYVTSSDTNGTGVVLTKLDTSGNVVWSTIYIKFLSIGAINLDSSGNIYICGADTLGPTQVAYILKYNSSGSLVWQKTISDSTISYVAYGVSVDSSGYVYVCGQNLNYLPVTGWAARLTSSGSASWALEIYDASSVNAFKVGNCTLDSASNFYIGGGYGSASVGAIAKVNSSGSLVWQKTIADASQISNMCVSSDNYIYSTNKSIGMVLKMDTSGNGIFFNQVSPWSRSYISQLNSNVYLYGISSSVRASACLPSDGSKLNATISGGFTYGSPGLTVGNGTYSTTVPSYTIGTPTNSTSAAGITSSPFALSNTVNYF